MELERGKDYNFTSQPERLKYVGQLRGWHQFERIGHHGVWCELLDTDLHMIEETVALMPPRPVIGDHGRIVRSAAAEAIVLNHKTLSELAKI
jgi:hypothetical protein